MTELATVRSYLNGRGGKNICFFSQKKQADKLLPKAQEKLGKKTLPDKVVNLAMGGGYCSGVCMEWLRRVLQGGKNTLNPSKLEEERYAARTAIGVKAFEWLSQRYRYTGGIYNTRLDEANELTSLLEEARDTHPGDIPLSPEILQLWTKVTGSPLPVNFFTQTSMAGVLALVEKHQKAERYKEYEAHMMSTDRPPMPTVLWGDAALLKDLDAHHAGIRAMYDRKPTKKPFSGIRCVEDQNGWKKKYTTPQNAMHAAAQSTHFTQGMGMMFVVWQQDGGSHAHGVYNLKDKEYYLFLDPNFGVWAWPYRGLLEGMKYLWLDGGDTSIGIYPENDAKPNGMYEYTLWEKVPEGEK